MSRQLRTLLIGAVLCLVMVFGSARLSVPYVVLSPGPTVNTLGSDGGQPIITVTGHATTPTTGGLHLTTVAEGTSDTTVFGAIKGWLSRTEVVVPHDAVVPPGQTQQQVDQQAKLDFSDSQNSAVAAAACQLKYPAGFGVLSVNADSPNKDVLKPGDAFVSLNGQPAADDKAFRAILKTTKQGQKLPAVITRAGVRTPVTLTLGAPGTDGVPLLGITVTLGCLLPFSVDLALGGIGGPSAGLMFALGIVDKIGTDDLTHGRTIAGTGTIDGTGNVGQIGGIQLKMLGAKRDGATVFLAPASNCGDVRGNIPKGLNVIKVSTLADAVADLDRLNSGNTNLPRC